jgi:hypothetical protein
LVAGEMMETNEVYNLKAELEQVKALARHSSEQAAIWRKKAELIVTRIAGVFNKLDELAHDESISDKQFIFNAGFLMSQLLDESKTVITN